MVADFAANKVGLFGAVLKDLATGQVLGHMQQTGAAEGLIRKAFGLAGFAAAPSNPISIMSLVSTLATGTVTIVQNQQIKGQLTAVQQSLSLMQGMQMGGLLLSGLGFGVSVVGFAAMNARLTTIGKAVSALDAKLDAVTQSRRNDELRSILARINTHLETVESLGQRNQSQGPAERAEEGLRANASQLLNVLRTTTESGSTSPHDSERIIGLTSMYRLAHEASFRALLTIDEGVVGGGFSANGAQKLLDLSNSLSPDALARVAASDAATPEAAIAARRAALVGAQASVAEVRQTALLMASQNDLSQMLDQKRISGPHYLSASSAPSNDALVMLPA